MDMKQIEVAVYLPDEEAKKFLLFQQHYEVFKLLLDKGVFNQKGAAITLHFDPMGSIKTIQRQDLLYSHLTKFDNTN